MLSQLVPKLGIRSRGFACTSSPPTTSTGTRSPTPRASALEAGGLQHQRRVRVQPVHAGLGAGHAGARGGEAGHPCALVAHPGRHRLPARVPRGRDCPVKVFMGTTMAQCDQDFGNVLGSGAVGVFASDRPQGDFNPDALDPQARALYNRFAALWKQRTGKRAERGGDRRLQRGVGALRRCPRPCRGRRARQSIAAAARSLDLPSGSLPNGGGVLFSTARGPGRPEHPGCRGGLAVAGAAASASWSGPPPTRPARSSCRCPAS